MRIMPAKMARKSVTSERQAVELIIEMKCYIQPLFEGDRHAIGPRGWFEYPMLHQPPGNSNSGVKTHR